MIKETAKQNIKSENMNKAVPKSAKEGIAISGPLLPEGSWQRLAVGVAAAAGGGLIAAALVGVGPAAIAGTAGYLAFRGMSAKSKEDEMSHAGHKH